MIEDEKKNSGLKKIEMKSMLEIALKSIQHESDANYVDPLIIQEEYEESIREERFYNLLTIDEKERWEVIRRLFVSLETDRKYQYIDWVEMETEFLNSYFENAGLTDSEFEVFLIKSKKKYFKKISKYNYGRELLDRFTIEKYLYLFCRIEEYKPTDIKAVSVFLRKDEDEIKVKLIKYFAKLKAITAKLSTINLSIPENPHLKDFTMTPKHYEAIIKVLVEEGIIDKETNNWLITKEYSKKFAGSFINSLALSGYLRFTPNYQQIKNISQNTFNLKLGDVNSKSKEFNDPNVKYLRHSIDKLVSNNSLNFLNSFSSILPDF